MKKGYHMPLHWLMGAIQFPFLEIEMMEFQSIVLCCVGLFCFAFGYANKKKITKGVKQGTT